MVLLNSFLSALVDKWIETLWSISWQVSILVALVLVISFFSRKSSPTFHYWLWLIVLIRLFVPLNLTIPIGLQKYSETLPVALPINVYVPDVISVQSTSLLTVKSALALGWFMLVLLIAVAILWRAVLLQRSLKDFRPVDRQDILELRNRLCKKTGIRKPVPLCSIDIERTNGPVVFGIFRPKIYLPNWIVNTWTVQDIEPVLLHELAHIKRYDLIVNLLQIIVQAVYFFHPLVWLANWKIRRLREDICDDIAIDRIGSEKRRYSESILKVVEGTLYQPSFGFISIGVIENKNSLTRRIKRIMSDKYNLYKKVTFSSILALIAVAIISFTLASENWSPAEKIAEDITIEFDNTSFVDLPSVLENVDEDLQDKIGPRMIKQNVPLISDRYKKMGIKGTINVSVEVDHTGKVIDVQILESTINIPEIKKAVVEAAYTSSFIPARKGSKNIKGKTKIIYELDYSKSNDSQKKNKPDVEEKPFDLTVSYGIIGGMEALYEDLKYPEKARQAGIEGTAYIRVLVGEDGTAKKVEPDERRKKLGYGCEEATMDAVKKQKWVVATQEGKPVSFWIQIPVNFVLPPDVVRFLPPENQPKIIGGYEAIRKYLKYPEEAKKFGIEGVVWIKALIGIDGIPERIELMEGLGNSGCNEAAIEAVSKVRFTPAMQDDKPVRFWFTIPIRFQLSDTEK